MKPWLATLPLLCATCFAAQTPATSTSPKVLPLEVELIRSLNSANLHPGDEVLGRLQTTWTDRSCTLPEGSVLHGTVQDLSAPAARHASLALQFHYTCRNLDPQRLTWLALLAPDPNAADPSGHQVMRQLFRSPSFGEGGGLGEAGNTQANHVDMSGRQNATLPLSFGDGQADRRSRRPDAVKTGQVFKLPRLTLSVGQGAGGSTVLSSTEKQVRLPVGAVLILLPESAALLPPAAAPRPPADTPVSSPRAVAPLLPPNLAACLAPACTTVAANPAPPARPVLLQTLDLRHLGYHRLRSAEMTSLEFGAAVTFLGGNHLLFTFNPHTLIPRQPADTAPGLLSGESPDRPEDRPHMVRAVLFDLATGLPLQTTTWRVRNDGQYLWPLDGNEVLVADGDQLRWLDSNLHQLRSFPLAGPLASVCISPDRLHYAIGVVHELHSPAEHAELSKLDASGPEEQVDLHLLDRDLHPLATGVASSHALPEQLLDTGRLELRHAGRDQYYLREHPWSGGAPPHDFARVTSTCVPNVRTLPSSLILLEGCEAPSLDHWYRLLTPANQPVLRGLTHWREFPPMPASTPGAPLLALTTLEAGGGYVRDTPFHGDALSRETVRIHRASDGRVLLDIPVTLPLPALQPAALAPAGDRIAVIDGDSIRIYAVPRP